MVAMMVDNTVMVLVAVSFVQAFESCSVGASVPPFLLFPLTFSLSPIFPPLFSQTFPLLLSGSPEMFPAASP